MKRIGITLGDINGIGPEVALKAARQRWPSNVELVLIGSEDILFQQSEKLGIPFSNAWNPAPRLNVKWQPGRIVPAASRAAAGWIEAAAKACQFGEFDALVTAPISKEGFHRAGIDVPGHTEFLAALTKTKRFAMMLFGGNLARHNARSALGGLRVVLATRHVPIAQIPRLLKTKDLIDTIRITSEALPWMGCRRARIAVCGLNPHAGEGGDIGREEITTIAPAIRAAQKTGINVVGPLPGDTVFHHAANGDYDAVIAMYHDQGLAPLKLLAFDSGVNATLGLPIIRTSPDHGTAFDIAGKGIANPSSMIEAVRWAIRLAGKKNPWRHESH